MSRDHAASDLIVQVLDTPRRPAVSCSFQAGGVVLIHMLRRYEPDIPILFVDTGYHFPETLQFRDELATAWNLNLWTLAAGSSVGEQEAEYGPLNRTDPDRCCDLRKVDPLYRALDGFDMWFTGLRREQAVTRADTRPIERKLLPSGKVIDKVNPLAEWSWNDVVDYSRRHFLPRHPLYEQGYQSIGCAPCTISSSGTPGRAGRWAGLDKTECGLHIRAGDMA